MTKATYIEPTVEDWIQKFHYFIDVKVRYSETDMSGHVNNTSYFIYFEQARAEYLDSLHFFSSSVNAVTADMWCHYHREAYFPELLKIGVRVAKLGNKSLDLEYVIISSDGELIGSARGALVIVDLVTRQPTTIPANLRRAIIERDPFVS